MSVREQQATVYHGGGRRWLTRKGAERAEAKAAIRRRCECDPGDHVTPAYMCHYHAMEPDRFQRFISLYVAMFVRPTTPHIRETAR